MNCLSVNLLIANLFNAREASILQMGTDVVAKMRIKLEDSGF